MVGFILTGHGQFAPGLASALAMVAGEPPAFAAVPFTNENAGTYGEELKGAIAEMRAETDAIVVFADLLGGTPFNQAIMASASIADVEIVTGANLPMLIECLVSRSAGATAEELVRTALAVGTAGIVRKSAADLMAPAPDDAAPADGI